VTLGVASHPEAQTVGGHAFEVASIKPSDSDAGGLRVLPAAAGRFTASNVPLRDLVRIAYDVFDFQVDGGPDWLTSRRLTSKSIFSSESWSRRPDVNVLITPRKSPGPD
jgi:hypothetical protein